MTDIPEDIARTARAVFERIAVVDWVDAEIAIAAALMAESKLATAQERERCANMADEWGVDALAELMRCEPFEDIRKTAERVIDKMHRYIEEDLSQFTDIVAEALKARDERAARIADDIDDGSPCNPAAAVARAIRSDKAG